MTSLHRAFSQNHKDEMMESLKFSKSYYDVGLMTAANHIFGHFSALGIDGTLEQREADVFLKKNFALAVVDGLHRRFCI